MEQDPKIKQSVNHVYFPTVVIGREEANYGYFPYLNVSHLRAVGAFIYHISYELGSADDYNQRKHINIFALKARVQTLTDDGSELRLDKIKRMMNMLMMNIAPLVAKIARMKPFQLFYPDIVNEFYMWNLCSPFCMFITDLRKRFSWFSKFDYVEANRKRIYIQLHRAIYTHMKDTYRKLKTRSNYYMNEPSLWRYAEGNNALVDPVYVAINKIEREEFARSLITPPKNLRISKVDFINHTLSLLLNEADMPDEEFNRDYCRYLLNKRTNEYKNYIADLKTQDPKDENKIMDFIFDEAEKILNEHRENTKRYRERQERFNNR